jgi:hypothetical protein
MYWVGIVDCFQRSTTGFILAFSALAVQDIAVLISLRFEDYWYLSVASEIIAIASSY